MLQPPVTDLAPWRPRALDHTDRVRVERAGLDRRYKECAGPSHGHASHRVRSRSHNFKGDAQMNIDWSKAPEGATGAMVANFDSRNEGGTTWVGKVEFVPYGSETRDNYKEGEHAWTYYERPVPWNGEGLPPVGTVCEYRVGSGTWYPCSIRYITTPISDEELQVVAHCPHLNGDQIGGVGTGIGEINFRPIRPPEQIAAEERESEIKAMADIYRDAPGLGVESGIAALYDAGYRKFEIVEEDV